VIENLSLQSKELELGQDVHKYSHTDSYGHLRIKNQLE